MESTTEDRGPVDDNVNENGFTVNSRWFMEYWNPQTNSANSIQSK